LSSSRSCPWRPASCSTSFRHVRRETKRLANLQNPAPRATAAEAPCRIRRLGIGRSSSRLRRDVEATQGRRAHPWAGRTPGTRETSTSARNRSQRALLSGPAGRTSPPALSWRARRPEQGADLGFANNRPLRVGRGSVASGCRSVPGPAGPLSYRARRAAIVPRKPE
jgi:hypothetical protein